MRQLIRVDGTTQDLPAPLPLSELTKMIGATMTDTVRMRHMGNPVHVMLVDDQGYETKMVDHGDGHFESVCVRALKPVNEAATALYLRNCLPGTTHKIVGDVVIVPDEDFS